MNAREWARNPEDMVSRRARGNVFRKERSTVSNAVNCQIVYARNSVPWVGSIPHQFSLVSKYS